MRWRFYLFMTALVGFFAMLVGTTGALAMLGGGPEGGEGVPPPGCNTPPPPQPVITSISPTSGPIGTTVVISGQNLLGTAVLVNGVPDTSLSSGGSNTNTAKTVIIPPGATTGHITAVLWPPPQSNCPPIRSTPTNADIFTVRLRSLSSCCHLVAFPAGAVPTGSRMAVLKDGKEVQAGFGSQNWQLLPGTYEVNISGKTVANVTVQAGHDTMVKVGVLRISAGKQTRGAVLDGGREIAGGLGNQVIGLPPGSYEVRIAGQTKRVTISERMVTDF